MKLKLLLCVLTVILFKSPGRALSGMVGLAATTKRWFRRANAKVHPDCFVAAHFPGVLPPIDFLRRRVPGSFAQFAGSAMFVVLVTRRFAYANETSKGRRQSQQLQIQR